MGVFKYAEDSEEKPNVASDSKAKDEAAEERKDSNAPAPSEVGENNYEIGETSGDSAGGSYDNYSGTRS